jgi:hypothetical protein
MQALQSFKRLILNNKDRALTELKRWRRLRNWLIWGYLPGGPHWQVDPSDLFVLRRMRDLDARDRLCREASAALAVSQLR